MPEAPERIARERLRIGSVAERMSREIAIMSGRLAHLLAESPASSDEQISRAHAFLHAMYDAAAADGTSVSRSRPPADARSADPIDRLVEALSLEPSEIDLILLAAMPEEHEGYASVLRSLNPQNEPYATIGLAAQLAGGRLADRTALRRIIEGGAAASAGAIVVRGEGPFFERGLALGEGLWPVLCGLDVLPPSIHRLDLNDTAAGLERWMSSDEATEANRMLRRNQSVLIEVFADSEGTAAHRASALVASANRRWMAAEITPSTPASIVRLAFAHACARGAVPIFKLVSPDANALPSMPDLSGLLGPIIICAASASAPALEARRPVLRIVADHLDYPSRERMWTLILPELSRCSATLASRYGLEPHVAAEVADDLRARGPVQDCSDALERVADCVRVRSNLRLTAGVKLVRPTARWDHLVLPPDRKAQLTEAIQRLVHQGVVLDQWKFLAGRPGARGVRMLLSGPPGTGKTLAAEVVARELGVDLMVVDISRIVSKWIGETEKHLAEAFDAAERCQAVLLFDEADALFGKRTEVSDAHDRYANLETAYLLSRLERFDGLAILSTNLKQNIDPAFLRRLEFVVDFDEPSAPEREALWRCHLPAEAPLADDVDLKELASLYPIVGGLIRNASVAAGFLAAAAKTPISRNHLVGAVRREYEKSAKSFPGLPAGALRT